MFGGLYYSHSLNYADALGWEFCLTALVWGVAFIIASYLIYRLSLYVKKKAQKKNTIYSSENLLMTQGINLDSSISDFKSYLEREGEKLKGPGYKLYQALYIISSLISFFGCFCIGFAPSILSSVSIIPVPASMAITLVLATFKYFGLVYSYCPSCVNTGQDDGSILSRTKIFFKRAKVTTKLYKKTFAAYAAGALIFSIGVPLMTADACMAFFNDGYGFNYDGTRISSKFTRYFELDTVCPQGEICHIYATLPEDSSNSVFINVHTGNDVSQITLNYDTLANYEASNNQSLGYNATSTSFHTNLESRGDRYVHSVYLSDLTPSTMYYFEIYYNGKVQSSGTYLTLPSQEMERNILLISGGDVGNLPTSRLMATTVGRYSPDVILVGGDLAYDNGIRECYYSHDLFLKMFEGINAQANRIVPLMFSVGNHDLGFNAFQNGTIDITENLFYMYYPQQSTVNEQGQAGVPSLSDRLSYFYHKVGNTLQISLDSGYMADYSGQQLEFLKSTIQQFPEYVKFGNYHVPSIPICDNDETDDIRTVEEPKLYWAPLFQEYKFITIFENHAHMFKKTYPMFDGAPNPGGDGVIYLGDGNWGVEPTVCQPEHPIRSEFFEQVSSANNVWVANISKANITFFAIDQNGIPLISPFTFEAAEYLTN